MSDSDRKLKSPMENESVQIWRKIIKGGEKSWVLFEHRTCVIVTKLTENLEGGAIELMREHGRVYPASYAGDFGTIKLVNDPGWVVICHPDIVTYVSPAELGTGKASGVAIDVPGRSKRGQDARELHVVHIEDKRPLAQHSDS